MSPFFSIITPVKNGKNFIERYLESLFRQTFKDFEVIIIDDHSNDNSYEYIKSQIKNDKRFKIFHLNLKKKCNSPYLARNKGIDISCGKYICFFDVDDYWLPSKLERNHQIITENLAIEFIFSCYLRYNYLTNKYYLRTPFIIRNIHFSLALFNPIPILTTCIKSDLLKKNIRFKPYNHEDFLFWIDLLGNLSKDKIYLDNKPLTIYSISPTSISGSKIKSLIWNYKIYRLKNSFITACFYVLIRFLIQVIIYFFDKEIQFDKNYFKF